MAGRATGQAHTAEVTPARDLPAGRVPNGSTRRTAPTGRSAPRSRSIHRAYLAGRIGLFAIPLLAIVVALGLKPTHAFSTDPIVYANFVAHRWSSPISIATTTATGVFALISLAGLTLLLLGTRGRWLAVAGFVTGVAGAVMMIVEIGTVVVRAQGAAKPIIEGRLDQAVITAGTHGTNAAGLVFGGAVLLTLGWMLLGVAIMVTYGLNKGDGALLIVAAPLVFLGGFFLHVLPTMGAFLLGAAGLGILFTAGRIAPGAPTRVRPGRVPAPVPAMSALARFTDDDLEAIYRGEEASPSYVAEPAPYESVTAVDRAAAYEPATAYEPAEPAAPITAQAAEPAAPPAAEPVVAAATAAIVTPVSPAARARADRGLGRLSRGISMAWQVRRAGSGSAGATSTADGTSTGTSGRHADRGVNGTGRASGTGTGSGGTSMPAKKSFSFASWSPFRSGDKRPADSVPFPAANGAANGSKSGAAHGSPVTGSSRNGSGKTDAGKNGSAKNASGKDDAVKNGGVKNGAGKHDAGKHDAGKHGPDKDRGTKDVQSKNDAGKNDAARNDAGKNDQAKSGTAKTGSPNGHKKFSTSASVLSPTSGSGPDKSANRPNTLAPNNTDKAANSGTPGGGRAGDAPAAGTPSENGASAARE